MVTHRIQLDISNETTSIKAKESQLEKFHYLINKSNNKTKLTMKIATDTSEMTNDGLF